MLKKPFLALLVFCSVCTAPTTFAEGKKVWACAANGAAEEDLFLVEWGANSYIKLYGVRVWGNFEAGNDGEKRWDFGEGEGRVAQYAAILKPSGDLDYYDFRGVGHGQAVEPAYKYHCRLAQS